MRKGQVTKQDGIDDRKHRGVGADTEGEGQDGDGGKAGVLAETAKCVADVEEEILEAGPAPDVATVAFGEGGGAELAARGGFGFLAWGALSHQVVGFFFDVGGDFSTDIAPETTRKDASEPTHDFTGDRTRVTPLSICSKLETSVSRCFRPAGVTL